VKITGLGISRKVRRILPVLKGGIRYVLGCCLPVLAAIAQGLTGFLGWRVTVDGVREERKKVYEWLFALASLIGIVAVGIAAYRGTQISHDLADLKQGQQKANIGIQHIESTPPSVTFNPQITIPQTPARKEHTRVTFAPPFPDPVFPLLPYHKDEKPAINVGFGNGGDYPVRPGRLHIQVLVVTTDEMLTVFPKHVSELKSHFRSGGGVINPHSGSVTYYTELGPALTDDDVSKLNNGDKVICAIAFVDWRDDTGHYETDFSQCFAAELPRPNGGFNWHINPEDNIEHRLGK
jgi:hypothetical protein